MIRITNISASPIDIYDLKIENLEASTYIEFVDDDSMRLKIKQSPIAKTLLKSGSIKIENTGASIDSTKDEVTIPYAVGEGYVTRGQRNYFKFNYDASYNPILPPKPEDGDIGFFAPHRVEYYWDATRQKWLSLNIFDTHFAKTGIVGAGDYLGCYGIKTDIGFRTPLKAHAVSIIIMTDPSGAWTNSGCTFGFYQNTTSLTSITLPAGQFSVMNLTTSIAMPLVGANDIGYRWRLDSTSGANPRDVVAMIAWRLSLN